MAVRAVLEGILGSPLTDSQWLQASLPISNGGFGLRLAKSHGSAAYLSSLTASKLLVQEIRQSHQTDELEAELTPHQLPVAAALEDLNSLLGDPLSYEEVCSISQQNLLALVDSESSRRLFEETVEVKERARLLQCVEREGAGSWLCALPSKALGLHLRRSEFVAAARYRLGLPVFSIEAECPMPRCRIVSDRLGDHAISCGICGERIARHNHVRDALFQAAVQAGLGPSREPDGLLPGSEDRPAS